MCKRRFSFHQFYNFLLIKFLIFISFWKTVFYTRHLPTPTPTTPRPTAFSYTRTNVREFVSGPILAVAVRDAKIGPDLRLEIYRGYYTVARRYELYFRVAKQYFTNERSE